MLRPSPWCYVQLRSALQQFIVLCDAPGMIWFCVSALSLIRSSVAPGPAVSILQDALIQGRHLLKRNKSVCHKLPKVGLYKIT